MNLRLLSKKIYASRLKNNIMRQIANEFVTKAFYNAIAGFFIFGILIYTSIAESEPMRSIYLVVLLCSTFWLYLGLNIRYKLKTVSSNEPYDNPKLTRWHKTIDRVLTFFIVAIWFIYFSKTFNTDYCFMIAIVLYSAWYIYKWTEINRIFRCIR